MIRAVVSAALVLAAGAASPSRAAADDAPADPVADEAGEANLESIAPRQGIVVTLSAGGGVTFGIGINDSVGRGTAATLRVAHVATPRTLFALELVTSALFHQVVMPAAGDDPEVRTTYTNNASALLVGAQYYVGPAFWIRGAAGVGHYLGRQVLRADGTGREDVRLGGFATSAGGGLDLVRWGRVRAGLELISTALLTRDGLLSSSGLLLSVNVD